MEPSSKQVLNKQKYISFLTIYFVLMSPLPQLSKVSSEGVLRGAEHLLFAFTRYVFQLNFRLFQLSLGHVVLQARSSDAEIYHSCRLVTVEGYESHLG